MPDVNAEYFNYWGKADRKDPARFHLLPYHCLDVAAVGKVLLKSHHLLRSRIAAILNTDHDSMIQLCCFLLAVHDIGKFAEVFQSKRGDLRETLYGAGKMRQSSIRHDDLGFIFWKDLWDRFIEEKAFGFNTDHSMKWELQASFDRLICCATGHHGHPARFEDDHKQLFTQDYFSSPDIEAAFEFCVKQWQMHVGGNSVLIRQLADENRVTKASWWVAGIMVVCDWIGSDDDIFGYVGRPMDLETYWHSRALPNARRALAECGLLPSKISKPMSLEQLAGEPLTPTPLQKLCGEPRNFDTPQLWILEDITGAGKTEAAMLLVNRMMAGRQADGFYIGLPTTATADAMYRRMAHFYRKLFRDDQIPSLVLAHGSRHLSDEFRKSIIDLSTNQQDYSKEEPTGAAQCVAWLADNRKKALLADVGVGTVDQALLMILPSRHQSMRLFGLGSKLLLVDEVHAHDTYMNQLLKKLLIFHGYIGGSAILLSATLPHKMRNDLVQAFQRGLGRSAPYDEKTDDYPLVTIATHEKPVTVHVPAAKRSVRRLPVRLIDDIDAAFDMLLSKASNEQCACWIRNTVWDACHIYKMLLAKNVIDPAKLILFHARFTLADRLRIEKKVVNSFGRNSTAKDRAGKILISTQVIENSLDLCLDGMVGDLAPIDAKIQRAGRLHRHCRDALGNRLKGIGAVDQRQPPILHILTPDPVDDPDEQWYTAMFPKAAPVYPHVGRLWLTARILKEKKEINMPFHLRDLIEGVYAKGLESIPEKLWQASEEAEAEAMGKSSFGKHNALRFKTGYDIGSGLWSEEIDVPTRLGEKTHTVYLAKEENDKLVPFKKGKFPWDLSSIKLAKKKLENISPAIQEKYQGQLEQLIKTEKRLQKYDVVIPVSEIGDEKWVSEGIDGEGVAVDIVYDEKMGIMVGDEIEGG